MVRGGRGGRVYRIKFSELVFSTLRVHVYLLGSKITDQWIKNRSIISLPAQTNDSRNLLEYREGFFYFLFTYPKYVLPSYCFVLQKKISVLQVNKMFIADEFRV